MGRIGQFIDNVTGGLVSGGLKKAEQGVNSGYLGWNDILLPGSSALSKYLDLKGEGAAATQFQNQMALDDKAREFSASEAEKQRAWEQEMSSTAIQRQVADAEAAGINKMALFSSGASGAGADTPSGSSASSSGGSASIANNKLAAAAGVVAMFLRFVLAKH